MAQNHSWYQTRYCLTQGIIEIPLGKWRYAEGKLWIFHGDHGCDRIRVEIFPTIEEAREDQRERAKKAIVAAEKKIKKLKELLD